MPDLHGNVPILARLRFEAPVVAGGDPTSMIEEFYRVGSRRPRGESLEDAILLWDPQNQAAPDPRASSSDAAAMVAAARAIQFLPRDGREAVRIDVGFADPWDLPRSRGLLDGMPKGALGEMARGLVDVGREMLRDEHGEGREFEPYLLVLHKRELRQGTTGAGIVPPHVHMLFCG